MVAYNIKVYEFSHVFAERDLRDLNLRTLRGPLGNPFLQKDLVEVKGNRTGKWGNVPKMFFLPPHETLKF